MGYATDVRDLENRLSNFLALAKPGNLGERDALFAKRGEGAGGGCEAKPSIAVIDGQMAADIMGWPLAIVVHAANISGTRGARLALIRLFLALPKLLKIFVDAGYKRGIIE